MISIGLTGWGDHQTLYPEGTNPGKKLEVYSSHFPVVEIDSSFYAIPPERNIRKWIEETPSRFQFVVKAYQGMTGHQRGEIPYDSVSDMFEAFLTAMGPMVEHDKLAAVLFQFPPWFHCTKEHVQYLRFVKQRMQNLPLALEFRHQSWFRGNMRGKTLAFMKEEEWIHSVCDEPQVGEGSIPTVLEATHPALTIVRFHGRNVHGWVNRGQPNWREVRYLYRYNQAELQEWQGYIETLAQESKQVIALFNNNSGGDAADNAKQLQQMLGIEYTGLSPRQLDLFDL
ncbi:DUF72 domain-containing protein [Caldalkalibacillus salinus]|uniref:DUF72 domain-containing protein n=1 Tax=Caldalkalibacillus salinus TaxID=2803787 RepID=UPI00192445F2|nr:DUF72 domain-containing protein [Caldalkalibacillus salinus]